MENYSTWSLEQLKVFLDEQVEKFEKPEFIDADPLGLVKSFSKKQDQEIIGLLSATIAWGNRKSIITSTERIISIMENAPHDFLMNTSERDWARIQFVHRTFSAEDLRFFFYALQSIYRKEESLEQLFLTEKNKEGVKQRIMNFRSQFLAHQHLPRTAKHISNPENGSSAKRLNMFLRWMVRSDEKGVDLGIWKQVPSNELRIPLDVHTARVARKLVLLTRKQDDWRALEEIHRTLDQLDSNDPAKYDFALFGLGISGF